MKIILTIFLIFFCSIANAQFGGGPFGDVSSSSSSSNHWLSLGNDVYSSNSGNVGIGTSTPGYKLEIDAAQTALLRLYDTADGKILDWQWDANVSAWNNKARTGAAIMFQPGNLPTSSPVLYLGTDQNVGIGTFKPTGALDIRRDEVRIWNGTGTNTNATGAGDLYVGHNLEVDGTIYGDGSGLTGITPAGWVDLGTSIAQQTYTDNVGIGTFAAVSKTLEIVTNGAVDPFAVSATPSGAGNRLIVKNGGNVGIGTTNPQSTLEINGSLGLVGSGATLFNTASGLNISADNGVTNNVVVGSTGNVGIGTTDASSYMLNVVNTPGTTFSNFATFKDLTNAVTLEILSAASPLAAHIKARASTGLLFTVNAQGAPNPALYIDPNRNVGIGTLTPQATVAIVKESSNPLVKISSSGAQPGNLFQIDANGNVGIGTWTTPKSGVAVNGNFGIGTWMQNDRLIVMGGNVGINSMVPGATLDVNGSIRSVTGAAVGVGACWCTTPPKVLGYCTGALGSCSACNYNGSGC